MFINIVIICIIHSASALFHHSKLPLHSKVRTQLIMSICLYVYMFMKKTQYCERADNGHSHWFYTTTERFHLISIFANSR